MYHRDCASEGAREWWGIVSREHWTPDMQVRAQGQYDNISQAFGMSVRYRWEFAPGSEFFAALGESADIVGTHYSSQTSQGSVRIGHTMRF